jgi:hypothetical protein
VLKVGLLKVVEAEGGGRFATTAGVALRGPARRLGAPSDRRRQPAVGPPVSPSVMAVVLARIIAR